MPLKNDRDLIGKSGEYTTKMFLFSIFNLIKKDKGKAANNSRSSDNCPVNLTF